MDRNCPPTYTETTESCISSTKSWLSHFDKFTSPSSSDSGSGSDQSVPSPPLVQPILTPRFAISTTPEVLAFIGKLAHSRSPSIAIQTHLSENPAEVEFTKQLFPDCETYAGVYDKYDLLGPGTILAHCVHLDDKEREVISKRGAGISHCPTSNTHLNSGAADVGKMLRAGIKVSEE
jgi:guanine deaminase